MRRERKGRGLGVNVGKGDLFLACVFGKEKKKGRMDLKFEQGCTVELLSRNKLEEEVAIPM